LILQGIYLPVTTPFHPVTGEVDLAAFDENLSAWGAFPLNGLLVAGSTGEAPLLDEAEGLALVERARLALDGRQLLVGTGTESTCRTLRLCAAAAERGADAVLVRPPGYYRDAMTPAAIVSHYRTIADRSPIPIILYHIPRYVPVDLLPEIVAELTTHENIIGLKDSSGDLRSLGAMSVACEGRATLLVGSGALLYPGLEIGAPGGILAVGLLAPELCGQLLAAWRAGDFGTAGGLQERIGPLHKAVIGRHGVPGVKFALDRLGMAGGPPRPPLLPLSRGSGEEVIAALRAAELVE